MLEQEKKEKNLKLWRIAVTVLMLLPMAEMLFVLPGLPDIIPVHWGVDGSPDRYGSYAIPFPASPRGCAPADCSPWLSLM